MAGAGTGDGGQAKNKMVLHKTNHLTLVGKCAKDTNGQLTKKMTDKYLRNMSASPVIKDKWN